MARPRSTEAVTLRASYRRTIVEAERALGRSLPLGAVVHHLDGNPHNLEHSNLVICPSESYHKLLHMRQEALAVCGNADYKKCYICKCYSREADVSPLRKPGRHVTTFYHRACARDLARNRRGY